MPSPFPGMDPFLEESGIWPDVHRSLLVAVSRELNSILPTSYYARIGDQSHVEIRNASRGHNLVTLIEILSPSNKAPGKDRDSYFLKQMEVLASDASLVEIDLLRGGERPVAALEVETLLDSLEPPADYVVVVNRAWNRRNFQLFPATLREWLPCFPVPLKEKEPEILLDLQSVFNRVYDGGPYRRGAVDYSQPPSPPLTGEDAAWAAERVAEFAR